MKQEEFIQSLMRDYGGARIDQHRMKSILTRYDKEVHGQVMEPSEVRDYLELQQKYKELGLKVMGLEQAITRALQLLEYELDEVEQQPSQRLIEIHSLLNLATPNGETSGSPST